MKTAKEWFQKLPEPYRTQALDNSDGLKIKHQSLPDAIMGNFTWDDTPQGDEYWYKIHGRAKYGEFDRNLYGWIPVSERLPEESDADEFGKVLVLRDVNESQINNCKSITDWNLVKHCDKETTMWQPLPKLPETL